MWREEYREKKNEVRKMNKMFQNKTVEKWGEQGKKKKLITEQTCPQNVDKHFGLLF